MKIRTKILIIILTLFAVAECSKDSDTIISKYNKYIIYLSSNNKVNKVEYYISDTLDNIRLYSYSGDLINVKQSFTNSNTHGSANYYLNSFGLADSCVTSIFNDSVENSNYIEVYQYNSNGYKIHSDFIARTVYNNVITSSGPISGIDYKIANGNTISMNCSGCNCNYYYGYNGYENVIDVNSFMGDYCGKRNQNLIKSQNTDCHFAPSTTPASSTYDYVLNSNGLVTQKVENYTPDYHSGQKPTKSKYITTYEYIYQ